MSGFSYNTNIYIRSAKRNSTHFIQCVNKNTYILSFYTLQKAGGFYMYLVRLAEAGAI